MDSDDRMLEYSFKASTTRDGKWLFKIEDLDIFVYADNWGEAYEKIKDTLTHYHQDLESVEEE